MKAMLGHFVAAMFVLSIGACATDDPSTDQNAMATSDISQGTTSNDTPRSMEIPKELSVENLPDDLTINGNTIITPDACTVKLEFCKDPRFGIPSYCSNGCTAAQAVRRAASLCRSHCGSNTNCNTLANLGGC